MSDLIARRRRLSRTLHFVRIDGRGKTLCKRYPANMVKELASPKAKICQECIDECQKRIRCCCGKLGGCK